MAPLVLTRTAICSALAALAFGVGEVQAQGTFQTLDPAYGGETARRAFFGGFALSGEAAYRDADLIGFSGTGSLADLSLSARLDYALLPQVDLALVADLSGAAEAQNGRMGLSWVVVKPYWHNEGTDYAVRLAVDPVNEGGLGFRQTEVAFLSTTALSPSVTTDLSLGVRRLRTGFSQRPEADFAETASERVFASPQVAADEALTRSRLVGQSLRASWGYSILFDPAGSRFSFGLLAEAGDYTVVETRAMDGDGSAPSAEGEARSDKVRSGVGWLRAGLEFSRPAYQLAPFVSVPVLTWADVQGEAVRHGPRLEKIRVGLRATLR